MDRDIYKRTMQKVLLEESEEANRDGKDTLSLVIGSVYDLLVEGG